MTTALVTERETILTEPSPRPLPQACRLCGAEQAPAPVAVCEECLGPLEPVYDPDRPLPDPETIASRSPSLWRRCRPRRLHPSGPGMRCQPR